MVPPVKQKGWLREVAGQALFVGLVGLVSGGAAGVAALQAPADVPAMIAKALPYYRAMPPLAATAVLFATYMNWRRRALDAYRPPGRGIATGALAGVAGGALAMAMWLVTSVNLPAALNDGIAAWPLREGLARSLGWAALAWTSGLAGAVGALAGATLGFRAAAASR
jgi:hypothetical protein